MQAIRIVEIPDCKMVSSGIGMFGDDNFSAFDLGFLPFPAQRTAKTLPQKLRVV